MTDEEIIDSLVKIIQQLSRASCNEVTHILSSTVLSLHDRLQSHKMTIEDMNQHMGYLAVMLNNPTEFERSRIIKALEL